MPEHHIRISMLTVNAKLNQKVNVASVLANVPPERVKTQNSRKAQGPSTRMKNQITLLCGPRRLTTQVFQNGSLNIYGAKTVEEGCQAGEDAASLLAGTCGAVDNPADLKAGSFKVG